MTYLLGGLLAIVLPAFTAIVFLNRKDNRETLAARELARGKDKQIAELNNKLATVEDKLKKENALRVDVEAQLKDALKTAHNQLVKQLENSGVADAIALVNRLSLPQPGVMLEDKTVPAGDPNRTDDDLIQP